jgi:hypothetical protein
VDESNDKAVIKKVDSCHKIKVLDSNTYVYNTVDAKKKHQNSNEIRMISIAYSDYAKSKIFEEMDGKIVEFLVQQKNMLVLTKPQSDDTMVLRVLSFIGTKHTKLKNTLKIHDSVVSSYI